MTVNLGHQDEKIRPFDQPTELVSPEVDVAPNMPRRTTLPEPVSLRQRLVQSGDLPATASSVVEMDAALTEAVWQFQARNGLVADGVVGARTLAALNAPVGTQIAQVQLNLARGTPDRSVSAALGSGSGSRFLPSAAWPRCAACVIMPPRRR